MRELKLKLGWTLIVVGLAWVAEGRSALAQGEEEALIPANSRQVVEQIYRAHQAERRFSDPMIELGRTIRAIRLGLRELAVGAPQRGETDEMERLAAATKRAKALVSGMRVEASVEEDALLARIESRVDELAARTIDVTAAPTEERATRAGNLVAELENAFPAEERRAPGWRRSPSIVFAPFEDDDQSLE